MGLTSCVDLHCPGAVVTYLGRLVVREDPVILISTDHKAQEAHPP